MGDERLGLRMVAGLTWCQNEAQRVAKRVNDGVDLCRQSAARAADRTIFTPPFLPAAC
jgi:hypothetical protein